MIAETRINVDADVLTRQEIDDLARHLDDNTEWQTQSEFYEAWSPRSNNRLQRLLSTARTALIDRDGFEDGLVIANNAAERRGLSRDRLSARVAELEAALGEALDIAEWEATEYQGKPEHLDRLPQLRWVLRKSEDSVHGR